MKNIVFTILLAVMAVSVSAQKLIDIYKKGAVKLIPDTEYAKDNNWDKVFSSYYDTLYKKPLGNRKSLILLPDGSIVVNHQYKNFYSKFSPNGKFEKEFSVMNSKGEQYKEINNIAGVINGNTFFTGLDNLGNIVCFDFNGAYKKTLKLDYMSKQMIALPNNKIAAVGWAIWKTKFREFVSIVDYETNKEKVVWEHFTDRNDEIGHYKPFSYGYKFKNGSSLSLTTMPFSENAGMSSPPKIEFTGNSLVVAVPVTGEVFVYDLDGNLKSKDKISWATSVISVEEQKAIQQKAINKCENIETPSFTESGITTEEYKLAMETIRKQMESDMDKITTPIPTPTFSTIIKDSDGNLLFFEFPKEENANRFNVWIYENKGKFVCQSSFVCDDYKLEINPSKMIFHNGYIYGLQLLKNTTGVPLRLIRFKISNS